MLPLREAVAAGLTLVGAALIVIAGWQLGTTPGLFATGGVLAGLGVLLGIGESPPPSGGSA